PWERRSARRGYQERRRPLRASHVRDAPGRGERTRQPQADRSHRAWRWPLDRHHYRHLPDRPDHHPGDHSDHGDPGDAYGLQDRSRRRLTTDLAEGREFTPAFFFPYRSHRQHSKAFRTHRPAIPVAVQVNAVKPTIAQDRFEFGCVVEADGVDIDFITRRAADSSLDDPPSRRSIK